MSSSVKAKNKPSVGVQSNDVRFVSMAIQVLSKLDVLLKGTGFKITDIRMTDSLSSVECFIDFASCEFWSDRKYKKHD